MITKYDTYFIGGVAIVAFFLVDFISPENTILQNLTECIGWTSTVCLASYALFNKYLWRKWPICKFINRPYVGGIWSGNIHYNFNGVAGKKRVIVQIQQDFYNIKICLKTDINLSKSCTAEYCAEESKIFYVYKTDPHSRMKDINPVQYGAAQIVIDQNNLNKIRIEYWTDRRTKGYMDLKHVLNKKQRF